MGRRTKIDWCDATWNPVTGCLHGCEYCYARKIAERFGSNQMPIFADYPVLHEPVRCTDTYAYMRDAGISTGKIQPYPFDFLPTFHRYKLDEPQRWKSRAISLCAVWQTCSASGYLTHAFFFSDKYKTFASIEPILEPFDWVPGLKHIELPDWIIVGPETGNRKNKVRPEKDWLGGIVNGCAEHNIPLFMKESLHNLMGSDFRQEFPWEVKL